MFEILSSAVVKYTMMSEIKTIVPIHRLNVQSWMGRRVGMLCANRPTWSGPTLHHSVYLAADTTH